MTPWLPTPSQIFYGIAARKVELETGCEKGVPIREHVMLAKTLGVTKLLVVVNKMDDPTVNWSKERFVNTHVSNLHVSFPFLILGIAWRLLLLRWC